MKKLGIRKLKKLASKEARITGIKRGSILAVVNGNKQLYSKFREFVNNFIKNYYGE